MNEFLDVARRAQAEQAAREKERTRNILIACGASGAIIVIVVACGIVLWLRNPLAEKPIDPTEIAARVAKIPVDERRMICIEVRRIQEAHGAFQEGADKAIREGQPKEIVIIASRGDQMGLQWEFAKICKTYKISRDELDLIIQQEGR